MRYLRAPCLLVPLLLLGTLLPQPARGQSIEDVMSREFTSRSAADAHPSIEDVSSREFTIRSATDTHPSIDDVASREFTFSTSLVDDSQIVDVVSREFTVRATRDVPIVDASTREFVLWNCLPVGVREEEDIPKVLTLMPARPNPLTRVTTLTFGLPSATHVRLAVYDLGGRRVALLHDGEVLAPGWHHVRIDGSEWAAGVYFYRLEAGDIVRKAKLVIQR